MAKSQWTSPKSKSQYDHEFPPLQPSKQRSDFTTRVPKQAALIAAIARLPFEQQKRFAPLTKPESPWSSPTYDAALLAELVPAAAELSRTNGILNSFVTLFTELCAAAPGTSGSLEVLLNHAVAHIDDAFFLGLLQRVTGPVRVKVKKPVVLARHAQCGRCATGRVIAGFIPIGEHEHESKTVYVYTYEMMAEPTGEMGESFPEKRLIRWDDLENRCFSLPMCLVILMHELTHVYLFMYAPRSSRAFDVDVDAHDGHGKVFMRIKRYLFDTVRGVMPAFEEVEHMVADFEYQIQRAEEEMAQGPGVVLCYSCLGKENEAARRRKTI